jgi:hypothetical protein
MEGFQRHVGRPLHAGEGACGRHRVLTLPNSCAASAGLMKASRLCRPCDSAHSVEGPEAAVDTVQLYFPRAPAALLAR